MVISAQPLAKDGAARPDAAMAAGRRFALRLSDTLGGALDLVRTRLALRAQSEWRRDRQQALHEGMTLLRLRGEQLGASVAAVLDASFRARLTGGTDPLGSAPAVQALTDEDAIDHRLLLARLSASLRECIDPGRLPGLHAVLKRVSGKNWPDSTRLPGSPESLVMALDMCVAGPGVSLASRAFLVEHLCSALHRTLDASYAVLVDQLGAIEPTGVPSEGPPEFVRQYLDMLGNATMAPVQSGLASTWTSDFAWSVTPKQATDLPRLRAMLPGLLVLLRRSLRSSGVSPVERERFLGELVDHYVRLVARALRASGAPTLSLVTRPALR